MVKSTGSPMFRNYFATKLPSGEVYAPNAKTGWRFPTKSESKTNKVTASAGPFSFKAENKSESKFTWTPLSAEFEAAASFALKVSTKLSVAPAAVQLKWTPALPGTSGRLIAATVAALTGMIAGVTTLGSLPPSSNDKQSSLLADMGSFFGLIAASAALIAVQQNMSFKLTLSPALGVTVHPVMVLKKTEGKEIEAGGIKNKSHLYEWKKNKTDLLVAVGLLSGNGSDNDNVGANVNAIANQNSLSGNSNQS